MRCASHSAEQRRKRPPSVHPVFLTHPITGKTVLYCNPSYATRINELDEAESSALDGVGPIPDGPVTLGVRLESVRLDRVTGGHRGRVTLVEPLGKAPSAC